MGEGWPFAMVNNEQCGEAISSAKGFSFRSLVHDAEADNFHNLVIPSFQQRCTMHLLVRIFIKIPSGLVLTLSC